MDRAGSHGCIALKNRVTDLIPVYRVHHCLAETFIVERSLTQVHLDPSNGRTPLPTLGCTFKVWHLSQPGRVAQFQVILSGDVEFLAFHSQGTRCCIWNKTVVDLV